MEKSLRQKFGIQGTPIKCTKLYRKSMDFDHAETRENPGTGAWVYITPDGQWGQAQTYSGNLGRNYSPQLYPMPDGKSKEKRLKPYVEVVDPSAIAGGDCFELVGQEATDAPNTDPVDAPAPDQENADAPESQESVPADALLDE